MWQSDVEINQLLCSTDVPLIFDFRVPVEVLGFSETLAFDILIKSQQLSMFCNIVMNASRQTIPTMANYVIGFSFSTQSGERKQLDLC